jgi:hypothetical protein
MQSIPSVAAIVYFRFHQTSIEPAPGSWRRCEWRRRAGHTLELARMPDIQFEGNFADCASFPWKPIRPPWKLSNYIERLSTPRFHFDRPLSSPGFIANRLQAFRPGEETLRSRQDAQRIRSVVQRGKRGFTGKHAAIDEMIDLKSRDL